MEELIQKAISRSNKVSKNSLIEKIIPIGGGCIHKAWCLHFQNGKKVFAKSNHIDNHSVVSPMHIEHCFERMMARAKNSTSR